MKSGIILSLAALVGSAQASVIYSNGPVVGGNGLSVLQTPASTLGFGAQTKSSNAVADDFTVSSGYWNLSSLDFFVYQNNARSFTALMVAWRIMEGDANTGELIASGITALTDAGLVGYRVTPTDTGNTTKQIYRANADIDDLVLDAGHYWLRWSFTGSLNSGPWQAPTSDGRSGNALQSAAGSSFNTLIDAGSQRTVELPFALNGTVPEPSMLLLVGMAGVGAAVARRRTRA